MAFGDNIDRSTKFRNASGKLATESLFLERWRPTDVEPLYSLRDEDYDYKGKVYPSLKKLYLAEEDLTEYEFANKYFESWEHWQMVVQATWFKEYIDLWRTELELKLKAEALRSIIEQARIGGSNSYDAKKYLISKGWIQKEAEASRRGRPTKAEIARRAAEEVFADQQIQADLKRLSIN